MRPARSSLSFAKQNEGCRRLLTGHGKQVLIIPAYPTNLSSAEGAAIWMQYVTAYGARIAIGKGYERRFRGDSYRLK
jgi:hypothetical protein